MLVCRVERHIIDRQNKWYNMLIEKCLLARNVYNHGNYLIRQEFFNSGIYLGYTKIERLLHDDLEYPDYWKLGLANSSQQILKTLDKNWKSFFKAVKDWKKHPEKYLGMPKPPRYLKKNILKDFALTFAQIHVVDNKIKFPKTMRDSDGNDFIVPVRFPTLVGFNKFQLCRIIPKNDRIIIEFVYTVNIFSEIKKEDNIVGIDLGLDNFVTLVDNIGNTPIIINGKGLKSCNQYYNKKIAEMSSELKLNKNNNYYSHKMYSVANKRNDKINHFMFLATNYVVEHCTKHNIGTIVIGKNDGWKQRCNIGSVNNQKFVQIPYELFIQKLSYKCQELGIKLIQTEESYTSGTSFLDNEQPEKQYYNKKRRKHRGLFRSNSGKLINADVNAAYQIMKKVFRDVDIPADRGFVMNPVRVNLSF